MASRRTFTTAFYSSLTIARPIAHWTALAIVLGALAGCGEQAPLSVADLQTVAAIEKQGGKVGTSPVNDQEFTSAVTSVDFSDRPLDAQLLPAIGKFAMLKALKIPKAKIADADLKPLESLRAIECVDLSHTPIQGAGLRALRYCKVRDLNLNGTLVDDQGMKAVGEMGHHLQHLKLAGTKITDIGLAEIEKGGPIETLDLSNTRICGSSLKCLPPSIRQLNLHGTDVTDRYLSYITNMQELADLDLGATKLSDESVPYFKELAEFQNRSYDRRRFKVLGLQDVKISKDNIDLLKRTIPRLEIKQ